MSKNRLSQKLYVISYLEDFSALLVIFAVTRDLAQTHASILKMGLIGGVMALMVGTSCIVFGPLSDRVGRRRFILAGTVLTTIAMIGCLVFRSVEWARLISYWSAGAATGMIYPPLVAWLNQGHAPDPRSRGISRNLIRFCLAWNLGVISGQLAGGWLFAVWRGWPIVLAAVLSTINVLLVLLTGRLPSKPVATTAPPAESPPPQQALGPIFTKMAWISNLGAAFAVSMIMYLFPKLAVSLDVPSEQHGTILALMRIVTIATYFLMHHWSFWQYRVIASLIAQAFAVGGLALLAFARDATALAAGLVCLGVQMGYNYFSSIYYSNTSGGDERRGFASGMHEATLGLGLCAGSVCGGIAGTFAGLRAPYLLAICVIAALSVVQGVVYVRRAWPH